MHELTELQLYQHLAAAWPTTAAEQQTAASDCIPACTMAAIPTIPATTMAASTSPQNTEHHTVIKNVMRKKYPCQAAGCYYKYFNYSALREHMSKKHEEWKPSSNPRSPFTAPSLSLVSSIPLSPVPMEVVDDASSEMAAKNLVVASEKAAPNLVVASMLQGSWVLPLKVATSAATRCASACIANPTMQEADRVAVAVQVAKDLDTATTMQQDEYDTVVDDPCFPATVVDDPWIRADGKRRKTTVNAAKVKSPLTSFKVLSCSGGFLLVFLIN